MNRDDIGFPLSAPGGGEGWGDVGETPNFAYVATHLTLPTAGTAGPLPLPPKMGGEGDIDEEEINRRHNEKAARRKAARERMLATKTEERGLLIVHTGKGKGKSTAAFGLVLRCLGHGMRVGIVQFVKGAWSTGERSALERFGELVTCRAMGEGFTWDTQDRARDILAASQAWETAQTMIADPSYRLVVLDELNIVLRYGYLRVDEIVTALKAKPRDLHLVVTGRNAKPELIEAADLVTEMTLVKHPFRAGVKAQPGIEF